MFHIRNYNQYSTIEEINEHFKEYCEWCWDSEIEGCCQMCKRATEKMRDAIMKGETRL